MPDLRTNKSIAQRFDVEFNKRPDSGLRRWRRIVAWACALVPLLLVGLYELVGNRTAYWAGPLSEAHSSGFVASARTNRKDGCKLCHTKVGQPLWRLVSGSHHATSVEDKNCLNCHVHSHTTADNIRPFDHSTQMLETDVLNCAVCHEEHRGKINLKAVSDAHCVACHGNLRTKDNVRTFYPEITSFADHAEFAASRFRENADPNLPALTEDPGQGHGVLARVKKVGDRLLDSTPLFFNHAAHLSHSTLLLDSTPQRDDAEKNIETVNNLRWKKLICTDCHSADSAGRYMQPIKFDQHCKQCHPLAYGEELRGDDLGPLSHVELGKVYVEARARLREFLQKPVSAEPVEEPRLPSKFSPAAKKSGTLDEQVSERWPEIRELIKGGCAHCHMFRPAAAGADADMAVVPPRIPDRWMPHSRFNHEKHEIFSCVSCHNPEKLDHIAFRRGENFDDERTLESSRTADVLMPSVAICQKCHISRGVPEWDFKAGVECVKCHIYHHKTQVK